MTRYLDRFAGRYFQRSAGRLLYVPVDGAEQATVTLAATTPTAAEGGAPGVITVTRTGPTDEALSVNFTVGGTATSGTDFTALVSPVTIEVGSATAEIAVAALEDLITDPAKTVIVTLAAGGYEQGEGNTATVTLGDTTHPMVGVHGADYDAGWESDLAAATTLEATDTKVRAMLDRISAHGRDTLAPSDAARFDWVAGAVNGLPAARMQSGQHLPFITPWAQRAAATLFVVMKLSTSTTLGNVLERSGTAGVTFRTSATAYRPGVTNGTVVTEWGTTLSDEQWFILCMGYDLAPSSGSRLSYVQVNAGTLITGNTADGATGENWACVGRSSTRAGIDCQVAGWHLINGWCAAPARTATRAYLSPKYGIAV